MKVILMIANFIIFILSFIGFAITVVLAFTGEPKQEAGLILFIVMVYSFINWLAQMNYENNL